MFYLWIVPWHLIAFCTPIYSQWKFLLNHLKVWEKSRKFEVFLQWQTCPNPRIWVQSLVVPCLIKVSSCPQVPFASLPWSLPVYRALPKVTLKSCIYPAKTCWTLMICEFTWNFEQDIKQLCLKYISDNICLEVSPDLRTLVQ